MCVLNLNLALDLNQFNQWAPGEYRVVNYGAGINLATGTKPQVHGWKWWRLCPHTIFTSSRLRRFSAFHSLVGKESCILKINKETIYSPTKCFYIFESNVMRRVFTFIHIIESDKLSKSNYILETILGKADRTF